MALCCYICISVLDSSKAIKFHHQRRVLHHHFGERMLRPVAGIFVALKPAFVDAINRRRLRSGAFLSVRRSGLRINGHSIGAPFEWICLACRLAGRLDSQINIGSHEGLLLALLWRSLPQSHNAEQPPDSFHCGPVARSSANAADATGGHLRLANDISRRRCCR